MHILVAGAFDASSQYAHAINTVKMAQGFARLGHQVTLMCFRPLTGRVSPEELVQIYGLSEALEWIQLPRFVFGRELGIHWQFGLLALLASLRSRPDLVFTRNYIFPYLTSWLKIPTVVESHAHLGYNAPPFLRMVRGAAKHTAFRLLITISDVLADYYCSLGVPREKVVVLSDAVDLSLFKRPSSLPADPYTTSLPKVTYVGHLYDYKGIPTVLKAAAELPGISFHFVGGLSEDIKKQKDRAQSMDLKNVWFYGTLPQPILPSYLWHADILVLPPSQHHPSARWTSPLKLGEYLASGTPIVASDIPALRAWVTDNEVEFVSPDDASALAQGIKNLLSDEKRADRLQKQGFLKAQSLSYEQRAQKILDLC